ncbi:MAG TPA: prepilin-type N-terminal cleavage/methylation domain-containing protein [Gemmatimonadaceae bacterium]|jgi:prepilin-type N-terminal cleavage/methylation domain-containing protein
MRARKRFGFTLIEIAVAAAIMAMLAMVTAPYFVGYLDKQRAETTADQLQSIAAGIIAFGNAVKTGAAATNTTYPGFISELTSQIISGSNTWHNSCTQLNTGRFNATAQTDWSNNGPFLSFLVPQGGLETPFGVIADSLFRGTPSAVATTLSIRMPGIDVAYGTLLDLVIDGGDGSNSGTLRMTTVSGGVVDVSYLVPVGAHC